jgi:phenylalanyl-tRNA synthetase beta chain
MRASYSWLKTLVDLPADPADLVKEFVRTGTEVEGVERLGANLDHVVTGYILECVPHPDSDHMHVTLVDVGDKNVDADGNPVPLQIVCGAPNVAAHEHVIVAMEGAVLPGDFKIKKSKLRGVDSCGMNCSARELGIGSDHEGIMVLPEDAPVGVPAADYLGVSDTILDLEITPNRPDCLSMTGLAVEVSAMYDEDTHIELPAIASEVEPEAASKVAVTIDDPSLCSRYVARVVENVKIGPSPDWLAERVVAAGMRPINNVVDITNYVMFLTGQPLHAFDLGKLSQTDGKAHIVVRAAEEGEQLETLDGQLRTLTSDMCVITDDGKTPVALAGVMGGMNSEIDDTTTTVLLESACFDPGHTSRTSRNLDLMSEASIRFERGVDASNCVDVADITAALFAECCGADILTGYVDAYPAPVVPVEIDFRPSRCRALCGADIETSFMVERLARLGCQVEQTGEDELKVVAPTNRPDLLREVDLVEEVLRLWGMDRVTPTLPAAKNHFGGLTEQQKRVARIGQALREAGLSETLTYNFAETGDLEKLGHDGYGIGEAVEIINPLVADQGEMRRIMLPGLLRAVAYNIDHGVPDIALYEQGRIFIGDHAKSQPSELNRVAGVMSGRRHEVDWNDKAPELDFYDAKAAVEHVFGVLKIKKLRFKPIKPEQFPWLQPGRAAEVLFGKKRIGWIGNVHPRVLAAFGIDQDVVAFELDQDLLIELSTADIQFVDIPTTPGVHVDLSIVVDEKVTYEEAVQRIQSGAGKLLKEIHLFDVYRDVERVGAGKKSMAFSLTYREDGRSLTTEEVEKVHQKLIQKISKSLGAEVRS